MAKKKKTSTKKTVKKEVKKAAKKHPVAFLIVALVVLLVIGGATGFYYFYYLPKHAAPGPDKDSKEDSSSSWVVPPSSSETSSSTSTSHDSQTKEMDPISFHFLTLGNANNGDSIYIKAGENDILMDAGSKSGSASTIAKALKEYVTDGKLEYVICTHAHSDHYSGMFGNADSAFDGGRNGILYQFKVDQYIDFAYMNKVTVDSNKKEVNLHNADVSSSFFGNTTEAYKYVSSREFAVSKGTKWSTIDSLENSSTGNPVIPLGKNLSMEFLKTKYHETGSTEENNNSIVTLFHQGDSQFLFTGDLEESGIASLLDLNPSLGHVRLFKAGHHGSINANPKELFERITPEVVAICASAGVSEFTTDGESVMPYQATIDIIAKYTSNVFCTTYGDFLNSKGKVGNPYDLNGRINLYYDSLGNVSVNNSANNIVLKDSVWFNKTGDIYKTVDPNKPNRTWPEGKSMYSDPLPLHA